MNKKVVILICVLFFIIGGLIGYIIFDTISDNKKESNETTTTTTTIKEQKVYKTWEEIYAEGADPIVFNCLNEVGDKECLVVDDEMKVSLKKELPNNDYATYENNYLYINDKKVDFLVELIDMDFEIESITQVDKNTIFVEIMGFDGYDYYLIDASGNKITNFSDVGSLTEVGSITLKDKIFTLYSTRYLYDYEAALCRDYKDEDYAYIKEELEYLGNGKFGKGKTLESKTVDEVVREKFGMSCTELKNSTDPDLSYHSALARGEM